MQHSSPVETQPSGLFGWAKGAWTAIVGDDEDLYVCVHD